MKRINAFTEEAREAFMETIRVANEEGTSFFRCNLIPCSECPLRGCKIGCWDELTLEAWLKWAMEEVKNETN